VSERRAPSPEPRAPSPVTGLPRVSVIVPCLNEAPFIESLLEAVRLQDEPPFEVIIVDGGSTDGTLTVVERYRRAHPDVRMTVLTQPSGHIPVSLNAGIRAAAGEVIARLDAHSRPRPDYLRRLVGLLLDRNAGVTGGRWEIEPGSPTRTALAISWAGQHPLGAGDAAYRIAADDERVRAVDTVPFGCFRKELWAAIGGFNEALQVNEDYEFNYRVRLAGGEVLLDSGTASTYTARGTLRALARQYFRYGWWKARMLRRHPASLRLRQLVPVVFVMTVGVLGLGSLFAGPLVWPLGLVLATYFAAVVGAAAGVAARRNAWWAVLLMPAVFAVVHFSWGGGALVSLVSSGRWPRREAARA
jgi:succinoglycan biosynthesis protein ExoA